MLKNRVQGGGQNVRFSDLGVSGVDSCSNFMVLQRGKSSEESLALLQQLAQRLMTGERHLSGYKCLQRPMGHQPFQMRLEHEDSLRTTNLFGKSIIVFGSKKASIINPGAARSVGKEMTLLTQIRDEANKVEQDAERVVHVAVIPKRMFQIEVSGERKILFLDFKKIFDQTPYGAARSGDGLGAEEVAPQFGGDGSGATTVVQTWHGKRSQQNKLRICCNELLSGAQALLRTAMIYGPGVFHVVYEILEKALQLFMLVSLVAFRGCEYSGLDFLSAFAPCLLIAAVPVFIAQWGYIAEHAAKVFSGQSEVERVDRNQRKHPLMAALAMSSIIEGLSWGGSSVFALRSAESLGMCEPPGTDTGSSVKLFDNSLPLTVYFCVFVFSIRVAKTYFVDAMRALPENAYGPFAEERQKPVYTFPRVLLSLLTLPVGVLFIAAALVTSLVARDLSLLGDFFSGLPLMAVLASMFFNPLMVNGAAMSFIEGFLIHGLGVKSVLGEVMPKYPLYALMYAASVTEVPIQRFCDQMWFLKNIRNRTPQSHPQFRHDLMLGRGKVIGWGHKIENVFKAMFDFFCLTLVYGLVRLFGPKITGYICGAGKVIGNTMMAGKAGMELFARLSIFFAWANMANTGKLFGAVAWPVMLFYLVGLIAGVAQTAARWKQTIRDGLGRQHEFGMFAGLMGFNHDQKGFVESIHGHPNLCNCSSPQGAASDLDDGSHHAADDVGQTGSLQLTVMGSVNYGTPGGGSMHASGSACAIDDTLHVTTLLDRGGKTRTMENLQDHQETPIIRRCRR